MSRRTQEVHGGCIVDAKCIYSWVDDHFCLHQLADIMLFNMTPDQVINRDKDFMAQKLKEWGKV